MSERLHQREIRIALDFDGTVVDRGYYPRLGPDLGAIPWLLKAQDKDAHFYLWTCRAGKEFVAANDYLTNAGVELYSPLFLDGGMKPVADIYLDDCNFEAPVGRRGLIWEYVGPNLLSAIMDLRRRKGYGD